MIAEAIGNAAFPHQPSHLYDPIRYILTLKGKRVRPLLALLGAELFAVKNVADVLPVALAIEYFHNFSLIHDDIMDEAPLRRGEATVHKKWNSHIAILSGDALLVKSYMELGKCDPSKTADLLRVFNEVALQVCEGQQLDMDFEQEAAVSEEDYLNMIRLKTSVLLGGALKLGAIVADAEVEQQHLIYQFGVNLGIAFQLQDDILDAFGTAALIGKQVGGDIMAGKKTILQIKLQQSISAEDLAMLERIDRQEAASELVAATVRLYEKYAIKSTAEELKNTYEQRAFACLDQIDVPNSLKTNLLELANSLMIRTY